MTVSLFVKDCMHENPVKISEDASIYEAVKLLLEHRISGLTVVDEQEQVVGVLSELDCLGHSINSTYNGGDMNTGSVKERMTTTVDSCSPDDDILSVAEDMLGKGQRRRPVIKDGKLVGQVSCRNILWAVGNFAGGYES